MANRGFSLSAIIMVGLVGACGPLVDVTDVSEVSPEILAQATRVQTFTLEQGSPQNFTVVAPISAYSCKNKLYDPPASKGDALIQLQLKALELGANAVVNVTFDTRGTDALGTNCWETVQASGIAVRY